MKDHTKCKRQFVQLSRAWYNCVTLSKDCVDEVTIGFYHPEGGTTGEFQVVWGSGVVKAPKLVAYDDSWNALFKFKDLLEKMAEVDDEDISPDAFCDILRGLGIEDATPLDDPHK